MARSLLSCSLLLLPLVALPTAARAQLKPEMQTGSLVPVNPKALKAKDAGVVRKGFARCIYRAAPAKAAALLENSDAVSVDLAAAKIKNVNDELQMSRCLGNQISASESALGLKFSPPVLRDMLAEEAYLARNRTPPQVPPAPVAIAPKFVSSGFDLTIAQSLIAMTDCAILANIGDADAILRTPPASPAERAAAVALAPALGKCLPQGQRVAFDQANIRSRIAYAMWNRFGRGMAAK